LIRCPHRPLTATKIEIGRIFFMVTIIKRERRRLGRFRLEIPAKIEVLHSDLEREKRDLKTSNISSGGAFFHTKEPLAEGTPVKIDLILPLEKLKKLESDHKQAYLKVTGKVLRAESKGMAISFDQDYVLRPLRAKQERTTPGLHPPT
jgi:hypothetical protein